MGLLPSVHGTAKQPVDIASFPLAAPALATVEQLPSENMVRSLSASGVTIVDLQSGQEIYGRNADARRPIGSLTKIMTAVIIAESHSLNEVVTVPKDIGSVGGSTANLPPGQKFTVGDLLSALLIPSANDAAVTLARFHSGSEKEFVNAMNARAAQLGLKNTQFSNASGLDAAEQWSTPRDIAWLASYALRKMELRKRMSTAHMTIKSQEGQAIGLEHTNVLLREGGAVIAGKTGTTAAAGQCLFSLVKEGDREYVVVLLGSSERYVDMRMLLRILGSLFA
jgi:D-alanyl-D-alanine carboxypeptidase